MTSRTLQTLFVDRLIQLERFRKSLEGGARRIILIEAGPGMGKSWLLRQFAHDSEAADSLPVLIDFADGQAYDALMLVRRFRDAFGEWHFNALTAAINNATTPRVVLEGGGGGSVNINLGSNNQVGSVNIGDVAGGNIIKDNLFIIQGDNPLAIQAIEDRVTTVFFNDLKGLTSTQRAIFLFDSYERTSLDESRWLANAADRWIGGQLLRRVREGELPNVLVVLAGRRLPEFGIEWQDVVGRMPLENFVEEDVAQYLRENRGLSTLTDAEIRTLFTAVQGNPQLMGIIGDNLSQASRPVPDDEW